jgi:hypothetical protein
MGEILSKALKRLKKLTGLFESPKEISSLKNHPDSEK